MAKRYYVPADVRPEHARQVLDFLNAAAGAEEIAEAVSIVGEPDVGPRLAQRILDRRDELGGFTDLAQLRRIPLIGPERFTELVACLSDAPLPWAQPTPGDVLAEVRAIRLELGRLRAQQAAPPRVRLRALQPSPYLGQLVNLVAQATDAGGTRPIVDAPITLVASEGRLRAVDGTTVREGRSVTTRTDGVGMARALLLPPVTEDLLPLQEAALQAALRSLPPGAPTPVEAAAALRALAEQYRWHGNPYLRDAIDVLFRDFGARFVETVNTHDYTLAWRHVEVTTVAYLRDALDSTPDPTEVRAAAALTLRIRNWLAPWLEAMQRATSKDAALAADLARAAAAADEGSLIGSVYTGIRDFLQQQRGRAGEYVGRRVAETALRDYAQSGVSELPAEWQSALLPALDVASATVATGGGAVFSAVGQTRTEMRKEIDRRVDRTLGDLGVLTDIGQIAERLDTLAARVDGKVDTATFDRYRTEIDGTLGGKVDSAAFEDFRQEVGTTLDLKADATALQELGATLDQRLTTVVTTDALDQRLTGVVTADAFAGFQRQVDARLGAKADATTVQDLSASLRRDVGSLQGSVQRIDRDVTDLRRPR